MRTAPPHATRPMLMQPENCWQDNWQCLLSS
jgi:hypothetical protein